jgi:dUTP pyrophosphatase
VCLPRGLPTLGTPVEVERMLGRRIPVLIVTDGRASVQLNSWAERGAVVCDPSEIELLVGDLIRRVPDPVYRPPALEQLRRMGEQLQRALGPVPLIFEPVGAEPHDPEPRLPSRGYADDAGLDLYVVGDRMIPPGQFRDVPCGVRIDIPPGHWGFIVGRSSTLRKHGLLVNPAVIDAGWTGELFAGVQNLGENDVVVSHGDRLAQLILLPAAVTGRVPEWGRVPAKDRGENGFGSTGV